MKLTNDTFSTIIKSKVLNKWWESNFDSMITLALFLFICFKTIIVVSSCHQIMTPHTHVIR